MKRARVITFFSRPTIKCGIPLICLLAGCSNAFRTSGAGDSASSGTPALSASPATGTTVMVSTKMNLFSINQALVQTPASAATIAIYAKPHSVLERGNLLPATGTPALLNSSQQMVYMLAATEHCNDLVKAESAIPDANQSTRKFFTSQPMDNGTPLMSVATYQAAATSLASSFWRRALTADENNIVGQIFAETSTEGLTNKTLLMALCTVQLSSASSLVH